MMTIDPNEPKQESKMEFYIYIFILGALLAAVVFSGGSL